MLYGKCIFSQSRTPGFQSFLREHGSPDGAPTDSQCAKRIVLWNIACSCSLNMLVSHS